MIRTEGLTMHFGGLVALNGVSLELRPGELLSVIGPNGSGKSTLFNVITGVYRPTRGQVSLDGHRVTGLAPTNLNRLGIARTFQNIRLFHSMTVLENVMVGARVRITTSVLGEMLGLRAAADANRVAEERAYRALTAVGLEAKADLPAAGLPYGDQKRLEIARTLATDPKLLLLDEPSLGLAPLVIRGIFHALREINKRGPTVLLVEQSAHLALKVAHRAYILESGRVTVEGEARELAQSESVRKAYLGV